MRNLEIVTLKDSQEHAEIVPNNFLLETEKVLEYKHNKKSEVLKGSFIDLMV